MFVLFNKKKTCIDGKLTFIFISEYEIIIILSPSPQALTKHWFIDFILVGKFILNNVINTQRFEQIFLDYSTPWGWRFGVGVVLCFVSRKRHNKSFFFDEVQLMNSLATHLKCFFIAFTPWCENAFNQSTKASAAPHFSKVLRKCTLQKIN